MENERNQLFLVLGACMLSILLGVAFGYVMFGGATVRASIYAGTRAHGTVPVVSGTVYEVVAAAEEAEEVLLISEETHRYVVTMLDGYIAVFYAEHEGGGLMELTTTPADVLPYTDRARLQEGIRIYCEESLARLLQDYGS
ncbi:MAG: hypothetical protein FWC16_03155 [Defluviitaleaceae bacterium]|nr:hypothetical protein [Defluviitaleaceae bacterium]MCL2273900.1 hypothetical protein [Defluviitaleaceae bacterium]